MKFIFHIVNGAPIRSLFKARYECKSNDQEYHVKVYDAAIFSNLIGYKKLFRTLKPGKKVVISFAESKIVDHTFMEALYHFQEEYQHAGGEVNVNGFDNFRAFSNHPLATRKYDPSQMLQFEIKYTPRQVELKKFSSENDYTFFPQKVRSALKYKGFPIQVGRKIQYEENMLEKYLEQGKLTVSDILLTEGAGQAQQETQITVVQISETSFSIPDFALEPENLWSKFSELTSGKDIDFADHQEFSKKYYLRGEAETAIRNFFNEDILNFLENHEAVHIESHRNKIVFYKKRDLLDTMEIQSLEKFADNFLYVLNQSSRQAIHSLN